MDVLDPSLLERLAGVVARAGRGLVATARREGLAVKGDGSPVTAADIRCEAALLRELAELLPGLPLIGEESAVDDGTLPAADVFALIDPLDGTRAFVDGRDDFCVNLAIVVVGEPALGVIGAPARGMVYAGRTGRNGDVVWRAKVGPDGTLDPERTPLAVRRPSRRPPVALVSDRHGDERSATLLAALGAGERVGLSSALKFAILAEGGADIYPRLAPTMAWDTAAGQAILAAAGGATLDESGRALRYPAGGALRNPGFIAVGDAALGAAAARALGA